MERFKKERFLILITSFVAIFPMALGLLLWSRLPSTIPTHWNIQGEVDGYSSKAFAVFGLPLFVLAVHGICIFGTLSDPKNSRVSDKLFHMVLWIAPLVSTFVSLVMYGYVLGYPLDVSKLSLLLVGIVFITLGNYLPKCKQNYTVGIKCPWTLNDTENWDRTHRFSGYLYILAGALFLVSTLLPTSYIPAILIGILVVTSVLPFAYSFNFYRKKLQQGR